MAAPEADLNRVFRRLVKAAEGLPAVSQSTSYGTPSPKVGKKLLGRVKDYETAVLCCPREEKDMLMDAAPEIYFETPHYHGWQLILIRASAISDAELRQRTVAAWRLQATKSLLRRFEGERSEGA